MTDHTPGPWRYNRMGIIRASRHILFHIHPNLYGEMPEPEIDANGRLCAAAPRMLELLGQAAIGFGPDRDAVREAILQLLRELDETRTSPPA